MSPPAPQIDGITKKCSYHSCTGKTGGESMSSAINIHNLFHILHPFWIHYTKTWILLSKQFAHLQHCTKIQVSVISHKEGEVSISYFILSTPFGSTITQRKVIESSCPKNMHTYMYKWQWSILQNHLGGKVSISYFTPYTPMDPPQFRQVFLLKEWSPMYWCQLYERSWKKGMFTNI
jgi:hypothetical protein